MNFVIMSGSWNHICNGFKNRFCPTNFALNALRLNTRPKDRSSGFRAPGDVVPTLFAGTMHVAASRAVTSLPFL